MKFVSLRRLFVPLMAAVLLVAPVATQSAAAQDSAPAEKSTPAAESTSEPALIVTLASMNNMMSDIDYMSGVFGQPGAGAMFKMMAGSFTNGLDMDRPTGMLVTMVDGNPMMVGTLPTKDAKAMLTRLEGQLGPFDELKDGTMVVALGMNMIYVKQAGDWAIVAQSKDALAIAPADPMKYFDGMGNDAFVAIRAKVQEVPPEMRQQLVEAMRQGFAQAMEQSGDADAAKMGEQSLEQLATVIDETDQFDLSFRIEQNEGRIAIDTSFTAVPGSTLASMYEGQEAIPSKFASVIRDDAAAYYHAAASIPEPAIEQVKSSVEGALGMVSGALKQEEDLNDDQRKEIEALVKRVTDLGIKSVETGKIDFGALLLADESQGRFVFGSMIADGQEAADLVKDFAAKIENVEDAPEFMFDIETYNGVTLHRVEAAVPADKDEARKIFGETLQVHIGTGPKSVYAAVGRDSLDLMKALIDSEMETEVPEGRPMGKLLVNMLPILEYAQTIESNTTVAAMIDTIMESDEAGVLDITSEPIENGTRTMITMSEGMLKAAGAAMAANSPGGGGF